MSIISLSRISESLALAKSRGVICPSRPASFAVWATRFAALMESRFRSSSSRNSMLRLFPGKPVIRSTTESKRDSISSRVPAFGAGVVGLSEELIVNAGCASPVLTPPVFVDSFWAMPAAPCRISALITSARKGPRVFRYAASSSPGNLTRSESGFSRVPVEWSEACAASETSKGRSQGFSMNSRFDGCINGRTSLPS